ncbi:MAG: FAD-binding oxidoreductase [Rhodospirillales bacterium]
MFETRDKPEHAPSYYAATAVGMPDHPALDQDTRCDVCVVGGGFTGLSSALHLAERGYDVVLLEGRRVGWGASGRNGGQIGFGQRKGQDDLESMVGKEHARRLWDLFLDARSLVRERIRRHDIPCDLTPGSLNVAHKKSYAPYYEGYAEKLRREYDATTIRYVDRDEANRMAGADCFHGGLFDSEGGHLHPLNYALGLARACADAGVRIFEQTLATGYKAGPLAVVDTAKGSVTADFVVLGCNGYLGKLAGRAAGRIMPINNYVIATEPLGEDGANRIIPDNVSVADTRFVVNYWRRSADNRLLFGGGESYSSRFPADIGGFVRPHMLNVYPHLKDARIDYAWGGTLAITMTRMPHFARLAPNVFTAQGYSGHGVVLTSLAGQLIAEAVSGTAERFDVFASIKTPSFPGGTLLRWPGLVAGMLYYGLRDRIG